eukprot:3026034-Lingulodinium_polyedra.AAC.1
MRSHRPSAAAAVGKSRVCGLHARAATLACAWSARACCLRVVAAAERRSDRAMALHCMNWHSILKLELHGIA